MSLDVSLLRAVNIPQHIKNEVRNKDISQAEEIFEKEFGHNIYILNEDEYKNVIDHFKEYSFKCKCEYYVKEWVMESYGVSYEDGDEIEITGSKLIITFKDVKKKLTLNLDDIPTEIKDISICVFDEIGYQRRGANQRFYDDGNWDEEEKTRVFDLDVLNKHWEMYFSDEEYFRTNFREQMIDNFVPNKTFVIYW